MFCPKCGVKIEEQQIECTNCGFKLEEVDVENSSNVDLKIESNQQAECKTQEVTKNSINIKSIIFFLIAIVVLIMFFIAASKIATGGLEIMDIQSVGGNTLEEAYYYELGSIYEGYAMIVRALGIFFASVLVWMGFKSNIE